jgi:hypothetical protein
VLHKISGVGLLNSICKAKQHAKLITNVLPIFVRLGTLNRTFEFVVEFAFKHALIAPHQPEIIAEKHCY